MDKQPITLHPYQEYARNFILTHPFCALWLECGLGKACDDNTIIPTKTGFRRLGDIQINDTLFDKDGYPTTVKAVYHHKNKTAYKIILSDERSFICCDEHLLPIETNGNIKPTMLKTILNTYNKHMYKIPHNKAVKYPEKKHIITPYTLGIMLKDGDCISDRYIQPDLIRLGLRKDRKPFIPEEYLIDSIENREQLLSGLLYQSNDNCFRTKHTTIAKDFKNLCLSLGYTVAIKHEYLNKSSQYIIVLTVNKTPENPSITNIIPVDNRDMTCFTVDAPSHTYLINDYIVTHNTLITLSALDVINPNHHVLIIAPKNIAKSTWQHEIEKFGFPFRTKSLVVNEKGKDIPRKKRLQLYEEALTEKPTIYFINREKIPDLVKNLPKINGQQVWCYPTVIIDESQSFKSHSSERFNAMKSVRPCIQMLVELTGTPQPKDLMDLWAQIYLLDQGARLGKNITAYRNTFFTPGPMANGFPYKYIPLYGAKEYIYNIIKDLVISMENSLLPLPQLTFNNMPVYMSEDEMDMYVEMMKKHILHISDDISVKAKNPGVLHQRLMQLASGAIYIDENHNWIPVHCRKAEACEYIINNSQGGVLIAYHFKTDKEMILAYFKEKRDKKQTGIDPIVFDGSSEMMDRWNKGEIKTMLLQPASAGHGLNLQFGGHTLIWYTIPDSLELYIQTNARLYRQGQKSHVIIHHLLADKTIDRSILQNAENKDMSQRALMNACKVAIEDALPDSDETEKLLEKYGYA